MDLLGEITCDHRIGDPVTSYTLSNCPKCLGKGTYGDINFDTSGKIQTITSVAQLKQQLKKILIENTRNTGYGFNYNLISLGTGDAQLLSIKRELNKCLTYFNNLQIKAQQNGFFYSNTELLDSVMKIDAFRNVDPRTVSVILYCRTVSGRDINLVIPLER